MPARASAFRVIHRPNPVLAFDEAGQASAAIDLDSD
jgi:hypothetical protein